MAGLMIIPPSATFRNLIVTKYKYKIILLNETYTSKTEPLKVKLISH